MNEIDEKQVATRMLNLLRARTLIYRRAKNVQAVGLIISLVFPIVGLIVSALLLPSKPFIAFAALMFSFLEVLLLDRWHRAQLKNAAKLQEDFDCTVLQMDWNAFLVGSRIDPEDVFADACKKLTDKEEQRLINWYPLAVKELPLHLARLVCQRTNLWYDSALRKRYRRFLLTGCFALVAVAGFTSLVIDHTMTTFVLSTLAPMTPVMIWALRECNRQAATCELLDRLNDEVKKLWDRSRSGAKEQEISMRSRELQDAIFNHRASSPLIFDWVYSLLRKKMESRMNAGAEHWVSELRRVGDAR
ncbi:S-4TM family putative pore-forming effector [Variovorax sp. RB3P1]|uniref:S-4TM family putative pore-forming effector n=1 Tax=Variovorax sp. RB3P1 TaxID=3443732 RepID=UPI003F488996